MTSARRINGDLVLFICLFALTALAARSFAQYSLEIQSDVRSRGMGEASTPLPDNPMGFMSNPALLAETNTAFARYSMADWFPELPGEDLNIYAGVAGFSVGRWLNFGAVFQRFQGGRRLITDATGVPLYAIYPNDNTLCVGYAAAPTPWFSAGVNIKYILRDEIFFIPGDHTFTTFGFDIGLFFHDLWPNMTYTDTNLNYHEYSTGYAKFLKRQSHLRSRGMSFGLALQNIGPNFSIGDGGAEIPLPHMLRLGAAWRIIDTDSYGAIIALDLNRYLFSPVGSIYKHYDVHVGGEIELGRSLAMRIGYLDLAYGRPRYLTVGASVGVDKLHADVSYIPKSSDAGLYQKTLFFGLTMDL